MPPSRAKPRSKTAQVPARPNSPAPAGAAKLWAALFLQSQGLPDRGARVKTPVGEIDLIAQRGDLTVFVEVKSRSFSHQEAEALAAVNRRRIVRAAQFWLARHRERAATALRFDVIFLAPFAWPRHIVDAFDATGL